ncbi:MAG: abortive infection bacteriophage resistance protein, partial [Flavobacteriaceae bacterium]
LTDISYYHLSIYFKHFQDDNNQFLRNIDFEDIWKIYVFDKKLRLLLLDILERIEKSFKCRVIREISLLTGSSRWIGNIEHFQNVKNYHNKTIPILADLEYSKELYMESYFQKYEKDTTPPAWIIFESLTFGQSVMIFRQLKNTYQKTIAQMYYLPSRTIGPWMYALSIIRNICAHHSRLWNKEIVVHLHIQNKEFEKCFSKEQQNRLFNYLIVIQIFLSSFNDKSDWVQNIQDLVDEYKINISHMGFPDDWLYRLKKTRDITISKK